MDRMAVRAEYFRIFREHATQLRDYMIALDWYRIDVGHADGVTAEHAAAWANAGYLPEDAQPLIIKGITVEQATSMDDAMYEGMTPEQIAALKVQMLNLDEQD